MADSQATDVGTTPLSVSRMRLILNRDSRAEDIIRPPNRETSSWALASGSPWYYRNKVRPPFKKRHADDVLYYTLTIP